MKIRGDYVTNSSSSSFILSFKDENSIYNTLENQFPTDIKAGWSCGDNGYFHQLLSEIEDADRIAVEDVANMIKDENWSIRWEIEEKLAQEKNMSYPEIRDFLDTAEGQKIIYDACKEEIDSVVKDIGDDKVIVEVEHGDGGEGEDGILEHEILPNLGCTRVRFSHH